MQARETLAKMNTYQGHIVNPAFEHEQPIKNQPPDYEQPIKNQPPDYEQHITSQPPDNYYSEIQTTPNTESKRRLLCTIMIVIVCVLVVLGIVGGIVSAILIQKSDAVTSTTSPPTTKVSTTTTNLSDSKPIWTTWMGWSVCDVTCGGGTQYRSRICNGLQPGDARRCAGKSNEQRECATWNCPDCNFKCTYGVLNADCNACECTDSVLIGRVTDKTKRPISDAHIYYSSRPYQQLATTTSTGMFAVTGVCATSQPILVKKHMFTSTEMYTTPLNTTASSLYVTLQRMELPFISNQPQHKLRRIGESVKFCCSAESVSPIIQFEWFHNGDIIESENADSDTLVITDTTTEDAGEYTCRVHNEAGVIYSEPAILTVIESNITCRNEPRRRLIRLPIDCIQPETNTAEYNVGTCGAAECYHVKTDQTSCSDPQEEFHCCQPVQSENVSLQCDGYTLPVSKVVSCGCGQCVRQRRTLIGHVVSIQTDQSLDYISIYYNFNVVAYTDSKGIFKFEMPIQIHRVTLTLRDLFQRVVDTIVVLEINNELVSYHVFKLKPIPAPLTIESAAVENCLPLGGEGAEQVAELVLEPFSLYDSNGDVYNGSFSATVVNVDMRTLSDAEYAPGDFTAVDVEGDLARLRSFGMFAFSLADMSGNQLSVGGSSLVRVNPEMIPACNSDSNGACDNRPSLWVLNERTGSWEMTSSLSETTPGERRRRQDGNMLNGNIEVEPWTWYNIDAFEADERCWAKVISYTSSNFDDLLPNNFMVTSIVTEEGFGFLRRVRANAIVSSDFGVCVPQACDITNPNDSRFTTTLTATFSDKDLLPAETSSRNFVLTPMDTANLQYQTTASDITMKPIASVNGPVFPGKRSGYRDGACYVANDRSKHFQFHCPTCNGSDILCNTVETMPASPLTRTYLTFYPLLPFSSQEYCFIGLRIVTTAAVVRIVAMSEVGTFMSANSGTVYGSREVFARKRTLNSTSIDACMEFKCSGDVYEGAQRVGTDTTKITINVKGANYCSATPVASDFQSHLASSGVTSPFNVPFTFEDTKTYGLNQGLHQIREFNHVPQCTNDRHSPQSTNTDHCEVQGEGFVPAVEIRCT